MRWTDKLTGHGFQAEPAEVVTSALATADLLAGRGGGTAYVVGERGIREALSEAGIAVLDGEPATADHVVVGWDREVTYAKLRTASLLIQRGAHFVATNADRSFPAPEGLWPGAGAILAALTATTGIEPEVVGKPHPPLYLAVLRRVGGKRPLVVGDRIETDIAGALALGWDCLLVLSGVTTRAGATASSCHPTFVGPDVSVLLAEGSPRSKRGPGTAPAEGYPWGGSGPEGRAMTSIADIRKFMEAAVGKLSPAKAQELARSVMRGEGKEQVSKAAQDLLEWSNKNRQRISDLVRSEVRSQLSTIGVASRDEVDALKKRVRELGRPGGTPKRTTAKKRTAAKRPSAKPAPAAPAPAAGPAA